MLRYGIALVLALTVNLSATCIAETSIYEPTSFQEIIYRQAKGETEANPYLKVRFNKNVQKSFSQIDKVLIVRNHLIPIIEAFAEDQNYSDQIEALEKLEILKKAYRNSPYLNSSIVSEYNVFFEFDTSRFQVEGIETSRLAINSGDRITFNGRALANNKYSLEDLVQIWLHEILHVETDVPLQTKDEWSAKVARWVRDHTQITELPHSSTMTLLKLPANEPAELVPGRSKLSLEPSYKNYSFEEQFQEDLQTRFLAFSEDNERTILLNELYKACKTYRDILKSDFPDWSNQWDNFSWPQIQVKDIRKRSDGIVQLEYEQVSLPLQRYQSGNYKPNTPIPVFDHDTSTEPMMPKNRYRIDYNPITFETNIQRSYTEPLQDGDFEVYRIQDVKQKRYVSIRVNGPDSLRNLKAENGVHLNAIDLSTKSHFSIPVIKQRVLNQNEVLLHFEIPQRNLEVSQIVIPTVNEDGIFSELTLRPSKIQMLNGNGPLEDPDLKLKSFNIINKEIDKDPVLAKIKLQSRKRIVGLTLELEHTVRAVRTNWVGSNPQRMTDQLGNFGIGRKYYFTNKSLVIRNQQNLIELTANIPEEEVLQTRLGPILTDRISWAYTFKRQLRADTLIDTRLRTVTNAWIHFEDGTQEKIQESLLPKTFSFISEENSFEWNKASCKNVLSLTPNQFLREAQLHSQLFQ